MQIGIRKTLSMISISAIPSIPSAQVIGSASETPKNARLWTLSQALAVNYDPGYNLSLQKNAHHRRQPAKETLYGHHR